MKRAKLIALVIGLVSTALLFQTETIFGDEQKVKSSFKTIADKFDTFLSSSPSFLSQTRSKKSPTGKAYKMYLFEKRGSIAYDIQKTNSLISPYIAYISVPVLVKCNGHFGDVYMYTPFRKNTKNIRDGKYYFAFSTEKDARACEKLEMMTSEFPPYENLGMGTFIIRFAYQDNKWVLKSFDTGLGKDKIEDVFLINDVESSIGLNIEWVKALK